MKMKHNAWFCIPGRWQYVLMVLLQSLTKSVGSSLCPDYSTLVLDDVYLEGQLFLATKASSLLDCATECAAYTDCLSFGFESKRRICHLHTTDSSVTLLTDRTNWRHSNINDWPIAVFGPCAQYSCETGKKCQVHRVTGSSVCVTGPFINYTTSSAYDTIPDEVLSKLTGNTASLVFRVKACQNVVIRLMTTGDSTGQNEKLNVVFGGSNNELMQITDWTRTPTVNRVLEETPDLVDCDEFRPFWLDWTNSVISAGTGTAVNENTLVSWTFPDMFELVTVKLRTYGTPGTWLFYTQH